MTSEITITFIQIAKIICSKHRSKKKVVIIIEIISTAEEVIQHERATMVQMKINEFNEHKITSHILAVEILNHIDKNRVVEAMKEEDHHLKIINNQIIIVTNHVDYIVEMNK